MMANLVPELFISIHRSVKNADLKRALKDQRRLVEAKIAVGNGQLLAALKEAIRLQGYDVGYVRPPHRELPGAHGGVPAAARPLRIDRIHRARGSVADRCVCNRPRSAVP